LILTPIPLNLSSSADPVLLLVLTTSALWVLGLRIQFNKPALEVLYADALMEMSAHAVDILPLASQLELLRLAN